MKDNFVLSPINTDALVEKIAQRTAEIISQSQSKQSHPTEEAEQLLTVQEAATLLHLTVPTMYSKHSKGELPGVCKRGKRLYFSKQSLIEWVKEGRERSYSEIEAEAKKYFLKKEK